MRRGQSISIAGVTLATGAGTSGQLAAFNASGQLTDAIAASNNLVQFSVGSIDAKSAAATLIGTTAAGVRFYPTNLILDCTAANTVTVVAAVSCGSNSASYNDLLAITTLTGLSAANLFLNISIPLVGTSVAASTGIYLKVTTGATATSQAIRATIRGFYL